MSEKKVGDYYSPELEEADVDSVKALLGGVAYNVKEGSYTKRLSPEEVASCEKQYAFLSIEKSDLEDELKSHTKLKKAEIKCLGEEAAEELKKVKTKSEYKRGILFEVISDDEKEMEIYDENGQCIEIRGLNRDEKQTSIFSITDKTGTDGK